MRARKGGEGGRRVLHSHWHLTRSHPPPLSGTSNIQLTTIAKHIYKTYGA